MDQERDFSLAPKGRHRVTLHADRRRRERTTLTHFDVAQAADPRVVVRDDVVVTVLPKKRERGPLNRGARHVFMMLYKVASGRAYAVRSSAAPRDERRYAVDLARLPEGLRARLIFKAKFVAFLVDGAIAHDSVRFYEEPKHVREHRFSTFVMGGNHRTRF